MRVIRPTEPNSFDRLASAMDARRLGAVPDLNTQGASDSVSPERRSHFFPASDLEGRPIPPREWLVPDLIPHRTVTLFSGDGGTGKSLLALQLAAAAATGGSWIGREVTSGSVLYLSAEDDTDELHRRLADILAARGGTFRDLDALTLRSLAGEDALLAVETAVNLATTTLFAELEAAASAQRDIRLIVLDTLADLYPANENDRAKVRQFIGILRGLALRWTGDVALNHDLRLTSAADAAGAEGRALPLTLLLLVAAFGTLAAALLPLATAGLAITVALGVAALAAAHWPLSVLLQNVVSMLGLGLGVDYALLMLSRFREETRAGLAPPAAATRALGGAGRTILLSAAAVLIGFAGLLLIPLNELRAVAEGGALVVVLAALAAVTLLPALLALLGRLVEAGRIDWRAPAARAAARQAADDRWRRWGRWVAARPGLVLVVAGAPPLELAEQARRMETTLPRVDWLPPRMESAHALGDLTRMGRDGVAQSLRVVVELPSGVSVLEGDGWRAVARVSGAIAADRRVERVHSLPALVRQDEPNAMLLSLVPPDALRSLASADQRAAVIDVLPAPGADFPTLTRLVRELRALDAAALTGVPGARLRVGGMPAFNADYEDAIAGRLATVVAVVLGGTLLALHVGFRSVLVPVKALALNLLSVGGALGAVVLVFQDGHGAALLGAPAAMGSLFPALPALVFCLVFGLSMDYEVFLVARVAEARRAGLDDVAALAEGLARTGGVITSAAAIMVVVFGAFVLGDFLMIKVLGFALATAVILDATVVRMAIGPALLVLAGRWNWWPGEGR